MTLIIIFLQMSVGIGYMEVSLILIFSISI